MNNNYENEEEYDDARNLAPENNLELNLRLTNSVWGKNTEIPKELKDSLKTRSYYIDPDTGEKIEVTKSNWNLLGFFTRDFRLANLDKFGVEYCEHYSRLANEWINEGFSDPFNVALGRIASKLELSQSRNGFLRKQNNTIRAERINGRMESDRKGLFHNNKMKR